MKETKGVLITRFISCSHELEMIKSRSNALQNELSKLETLISLDNELSEFIIAGGISTLSGNILTFNEKTNKLQIRKCVCSYDINTLLTDEQMESLK